MDDDEGMRRAIEVAVERARRPTVSPNPSVGCVLVARDATLVEGWTHPPGGLHAEAHALARCAELGVDAAGATVYVTLEPCSHHGRTPPCADALVAAGVGRVVVGIADPDGKVAGRGLERLRQAGIAVDVIEAPAAERHLAAYLHHRRTGRPRVTLKLASTLDGRTAAPDGTSQWITGPEARRDVQRLRGDHDAILVGAGTVRADDPRLTVRDPADGPSPRRFVLGKAPEGAKVHPCTELCGDLGAVLDRMGAEGVTSLLVEGGAHVAHDLLAAGLVDRIVLYLAPALFGGDDALGLFAGPGAPSMGDLRRYRTVAVYHHGEDLRLDLLPTDPKADA